MNPRLKQVQEVGDGATVIDLVKDNKGQHDLLRRNNEGGRFGSSLR